jgi:RNA polymerase sigma-70 factor (ECF subfamily)
LLAAFGLDYEKLRSRLAKALRSPDLAADALHDAYLKLRTCPAIGDVQRPTAYLHRMALNLASNRRRHETFFSPGQSDPADLVDEAPGPERVVAARHEMTRALAALDQLPPRRKAIFLARWQDDLDQAEIAARFHLHKRTVQKELSRAQLYLRARLAR